MQQNQGIAITGNANSAVFAPVTLILSKYTNVPDFIFKKLFF